MKKILSLVLALMLLLTATACTQQSANPNGGSDPTTPTKDPATLDKLYQIKSYSGTAEAVAAARDTVIATLGDAQLTNGLFQMYFWMDVYDFLNNYGSYVSSYGLDISKPLDAQGCPNTDGTWQHHFVGSALEAWRYYQSLALAFDEAGMVMSEEHQKKLDGLEDELKADAEEGKFESIDAMIQTDAGPGALAEDYYLYTTLYYKAYSYFNNTLDAIDITDEMIDEYFTKNQAKLSVDGITKDTGDCCSVRHILFQVPTEAKDADWEECRQKAEDTLNKWLAGGATEDSFAALAKELSEDPGSQEQGGMYNGLTSQTNFVQEFKDWYLAEGRQVGDYGIVKTSYGYHIMYYSGTEPIWYYYCREMIRDEKANELVNNAVSKNTLSVDYEKILIGEVQLVKEAEDK